MGFHPFEVNPVHITYAFLAGFVTLFGMLSLIIKEKLYIGEAPIAVVTGIIIGPYALGLFNPRGWGGGQTETAEEITLEVTRVVIAISVFAVGVELPKAYMKRHWRSLFVLLGPGMIWAWMISALLIWGFVPGLTFLSSLLIAAAVTPTDPILAQAVIGGKFADKHVPAHIRHILSAESGSNDGAAFPFLGIALYLTIEKNTGTAIGRWFYYTLVYQIILGILLGSLLGFSARKFMKFAERKKLIDRQSFVAQYISLAILSTGGTALLGSDDLLSAFACGTAFAWDGFFNKATEDAVFSNVIDLLFNCAAFIYIGAIIPFDMFNDTSIGLHSWRLALLAICVLLFRRLPIVLATYRFIPDVKTLREALFVGWFGPMGVGAIFIGTLAVSSLPAAGTVVDPHHAEQVERIRVVLIPIVSFLVLSSVITHGMSIPFFSLGRRVHSITYTWSRNPSMDTRRDDEPAWTTHARRIQPGQKIVINRDEDPEEGDLGMRMGEKAVNSEQPSSPVEDESGGSSSSRTAAGREVMEKSESRQLDSDEERSLHEEREAADGEDVMRDEPQGGRSTPPLAQYREGNHLIIERRRGSGHEVEVEVIRNKFAKEKETEKQTFVHPHHLKVKEVDRLAKHLPFSLEHAVSHVEHHGKEAVDRLGLGLMQPIDSTASLAGSIASPEQAAQELEGEREDLREEAQEDREVEEGDGFEDIDSDVEEASRRKKPKLPAIKIGTGAKKGLRQLFGRRRGSSPSPSAAEEGRVPTDLSLLSPPTSFDPRAQPKPTAISGDNDHSLTLTRTTSASRTIRFADASSKSSNSAPGKKNYGAMNPNFKGNPSLAMTRAASIESMDLQGEEGPSVSFKEPDKRR